MIELERFLDTAQLAKLSPLTIIHGKGTGALRAAVQQYLRRDRRVAGFRREIRRRRGRRYRCGAEMTPKKCAVRAKFGAYIARRLDKLTIALKRKAVYNYDASV